MGLLEKDFSKIKELEQYVKRFHMAAMNSSDELWKDFVKSDGAFTYPFKGKTLSCLWEY